MNVKMVRAFVAVPLPAGTQTYLAETGRGYEQRLPAGAVRWVQPERMHLTLRFLGDTPANKLAAIGEALDTVARTYRPFQLHVGRLGCFPNPRRPRVIWAGLAGAEKELAALKAAVDEALAPLGWPPERDKFRAHLTLGRVKHSERDIRLEWGTPLEARPVPVQAIHLVESELRPAGPQYTVRHSAVLAAGTALETHP